MNPYFSFPNCPDTSLQKRLFLLSRLNIEECSPRIESQFFHFSYRNSILGKSFLLEILSLADETPNSLKKSPYSYATRDYFLVSFFISNSISCQRIFLPKRPLTKKDGCPTLKSWRIRRKKYITFIATTAVSPHSSSSTASSSSMTSPCQQNMTPSASLTSSLVETMTPSSSLTSPMNQAMTTSMTSSSSLSSAMQQAMTSSMISSSSLTSPVQQGNITSPSNSSTISSSSYGVGALSSQSTPVESMVRN